MTKSKICLLWLLLFMSSSTNGQTFCYAEAGYGAGTHCSDKIALHIINRNNDFTLAYYYQWRGARNIPSDYDPHLTLWGYEDLKELLKLVCPIYGKVIFSSNSAIRYVLKGGLAFGEIREPVNFEPVIKGWFYFGPNYSYNYKDDFIFGFALNPSIEFPLSKAFGLSLGLYTIVTSPAFSFGIDGNIMLGKLRNKKVRSKT